MRIYWVEVRSPEGEVIKELNIGVDCRADEDDSMIDYLHPCHTTDLAERISEAIAATERALKTE